MHITSALYAGNLREAFAVYRKNSVQHDIAGHGCGYQSHPGSYIYLWLFRPAEDGSGRSCDRNTAGSDYSFIRIAVLQSQVQQGYKAVAEIYLQTLWLGSQADIYGRCSVHPDDVHRVGHDLCDEQAFGRFFGYCDGGLRSLLQAAELFLYAGVWTEQRTDTGARLQLRSEKKGQNKRSIEVLDASCCRYYGGGNHPFLAVPGGTAGLL